MAGERGQLLEKGSDGYRWVAAAVGANSAAGYQLASDEPIMAIGGFNGTDPTPTLAEFQKFVANGDVHYFIAGGGVRWRRGVRRRRYLEHVERDQVVGREQLRLHHRQRRDRLRPHFPLGVAVSPTLAPANRRRAQRVAPQEQRPEPGIAGSQ